MGSDSVNVGPDQNAWISETNSTAPVIGASQAPGRNPLRIGGVTFNTSECPTELPVGITQMLASKTLPGGTKIVQKYGPSLKDITWKGNLFDAFVAARVAQMRLYAASGENVTLSWVKSNYAVVGAALQNNIASTPQTQINENYTVVVKDFDAVFLAQYATYSITLEVVQANNGAYAAKNPQTVDSQIATLNSQALTLTNAMNADAGDAASELSDLADTMTALNSQIQAATPISQNPLASPNIQQTIQTAQTALTAVKAAMSTNNSGLANAIQLGGILTAISRNVALGYAPTTVSLQGGNLFKLASQTYGDVSQAFTLARVAGLPSPFLPSGVFSPIPLPNLTGFTV